MHLLSQQTEALGKQSVIHVATDLENKVKNGPFLISVMEPKSDAEIFIHLKWNVMAACGLMLLSRKCFQFSVECCI